MIPKTIKENKLQLLIERGAFQYDRFELKDTLITYFPFEERISEQEGNYNKISKKYITISQRDSLIKYIQHSNIFNLPNYHSNETTCDSGLRITVTINGETKKITCEDFRRGCPEEIQYLEKQIIILHDKELTRKFLPG